MTLSIDMQKVFADIVPFLRCPISQQSIILDDGCFVTSDKSIIYPVVDGILCMVPDVATYSDGSHIAIDQTTESVRDFYDQIGWEQDNDGIFEDALRFEDLRPVSSEYIKKCHQRVRNVLPHQGEYILDVASGPVQYDDYLKYHEGFEKRVCVDISFSALRAARQKLGSKGIYILGDITQLPFKENTFDAVVSLHTIYHVPFDFQAQAFKEIYRTLKSGKTAAIVYSWGENSLFRTLPRLPWRMLSNIRSKLSKLRLPRQPLDKEDHKLDLYSHQASPKWFLQSDWPFKFELSPWRSLDVELMKAVIKPWAFGRVLLRVVFAIEQRFPNKIAVWGQYPLIKIFKD